MRIEIKGVDPEASYLATLIRKREDYCILAQTAKTKMAESQKLHGGVGITIEEILLQDMEMIFTNVARQTEEAIHQLIPTL